MIVRTFEPDDIEKLVMQPAQSYLGTLLTGKGYGEALARGEAWTGIEDGLIVACGGIVPICEGMGTAWAMMATGIGNGFIHVHRIAQRALLASTLRRIEAQVDCSFNQGHRWAIALGFELEAKRMRKFTPDGRDAALYARVR